MALMRLDNGESGELATPLTKQHLEYVGGATLTEADSQPDYNTLIAPKVVHGFANLEDLTLALAKVGDLFTNRYGDDIFGILEWQAAAQADFINGAILNIGNGAVINVLSGGEIECRSGAIVDFQDGCTPSFATTPGAPFTVAAGAAVVTNLDADKVDGANASATPSNGIIVIANANGFLTTPAAAPTVNYEVANKKYVDDSSGAIIDHDHSVSGTNHGGQLVPGTIFAAGNKTGTGKAVLDEFPTIKAPTISPTSASAFISAHEYYRADGTPVYMQEKGEARTQVDASYAITTVADANNRRTYIFYCTYTATGAGDVWIDVFDATLHASDDQIMIHVEVMGSDITGAASYLLCDGMWHSRRGVGGTTFVGDAGSTGGCAQQMAWDGTSKMTYSLNRDDTVATRYMVKATVQAC